MVDLFLDKVVAYRYSSVPNVRIIIIFLIESAMSGPSEDESTTPAVPYQYIPLQTGMYILAAGNAP